MPPTPTSQPKAMNRDAGRTIFGSGASEYHAVRSGYPAALFDHLRERIVVNPRVLEIGPGSGLATAGLLTLEPSDYVGVESDELFIDYLRSGFKQTKMRFVHAPFPSPDLEGQFDLAACAAAFHWLEPHSALAALRRLLRPGGIWAMWWNSYLTPSADATFAAAAMQILREEEVALPPSFGADGHQSLDVDGQTRLLVEAGLTDVVHRVWTEIRPLDASSASALFSSFSFIRSLPVQRRTRILDRIVRRVDEDFNGLAPLPVVTACFTAVNPNLAEGEAL